ncbi:MAG: hypothetical protein ACW9XA_05150 [Candidatus Nitrosopumilus sp. bin_6a]
MALVGSETIDAENNEISDSIKSALKKFGLTENELRLEFLVTKPLVFLKSHKKFFCSFL